MVKRFSDDDLTTMWPWHQQAMYLIISSWSITISTRGGLFKKLLSLYHPSLEFWWVITGKPWWRHQMEAFSALLTLCAGNSPVNGEFPSQRPVTRSFDAFFDLRLSKQWWGWWFETPSRSLLRHCNDWGWVGVGWGVGVGGWGGGGGGGGGGGWGWGASFITFWESNIDQHDKSKIFQWSQCSWDFVGHLKNVIHSTTI